MGRFDHFCGSFWPAAEVVLVFVRYFDSSIQPVNSSARRFHSSTHEPLKASLIDRLLDYQVREPASHLQPVTQNGYLSLFSFDSLSHFFGVRGEHLGDVQCLIMSARANQSKLMTLKGAKLFITLLFEWVASLNTSLLYHY